MRSLLLFLLLAFVAPPARSADPATPIDFTLFTGTYMATLTAPQGVSGEQRLSGSVKASVRANGMATGALRIVGKSFPFALEFDAAGHASTTLRLGPTTATLTFDLLSIQNSPRLAGSIAVGTNVLNFQGARAAVSAERGRYLFYLTTSNPSPSVPSFVGSGAIQVSATGSARVIGRLLLGGPASQGAALLEDGSVALDLVPASRTGILAGTISLNYVEGPYLYGSLPYFQAPHPRRPHYPEGIETVVDFLATAHQVRRPPLAPAAPGNPLLVLIDGGDLAGPSNLPARMLPTGLILPPATWRYSIGYADPITGFVRGVFIHPETNRPTIFTGVIDHASSEVQAGFLGPTKAGRVRIVPDGGVM